MKIIGVDERLAEKSGAKILIVGPSGVGKTSLLKTLLPDLLATTLFVDIEAGHLAIADLPVAAIRPRTWEECRDIACVLGGPNPALPPTAAYSTTHFESVVANADMARLADFGILFVDSLTAVARISFANAEQQPEALNERGRKDLRGACGLHARQMIGWLNQLQQARGRHVVMVAILEKVVDDFNRIEWQADRRFQDRARAARHCRRDRDHAIPRLRRRRAGARVRMHEPEPMGLASKGSQRPAQTNRRTA